MILKFLEFLIEPGVYKQVVTNWGIKVFHIEVDVQGQCFGNWELLHLYIISRSPYKLHFFHFRRKPVSVSHSFRFCIDLKSAVGVLIIAVSSQKNNRLPKPWMRCNFFSYELHGEGEERV